MATWGSTGQVKYTVLTTDAAETGETRTVGNALTAAFSYAGAAITAAVEAVADLDSPSAWTNILSLTGCYHVFPRGSNIVSLTVDTTEDAGEGMRAQVIIDGTTAADIKVIRDAGGDTEMTIYAPALSITSELTGIPIYCATSFLVRACRKGEFADSSSIISACGFHYATATVG